MLHNLRLIQRRHAGKSSVKLMPIMVASLSLLLLGITLMSAR